MNAGPTHPPAPFSRVAQRATRGSIARSNVPYLLVAAALSVVIAHVPVVAALIFPFRLMATFVHESSHAAVALLTGGQVAEMVIHGDLSGETYVRGGAELLVDSAGYLGTAL